LRLPQKDRDYLTTGTFCHNTLERFHQSYIDGCTEPYNITITKAFKEAWAEYKEKMTPEMKKECWGMIDQYLRLITADKKAGKQFNVLAVEKRFELPIAENIILNGAIDRIKIDDYNTLTVEDYKTTKNTKYLKNDWFQLLTYAYVLAQEDPSIKKVRGSYILLRHNFEEISKEFDIDEIMTVGDKFRKYAEQIRNETEFAPSPGPLCKFCSFLEHCSEGKSKCFDQPEVYGEINW
jgi:CRISPR/Cas system-associated exonuclease Cas4 (RecB family)